MAANKTMSAVQYDCYGGGAAALKHVDDVPIPSPKQGEVLLKVEATSLNPLDWKIQNGLGRPFLPSKFPFIPAVDVAGEVVQVGPRVDNFSVGDRVVSMLPVKTGGGLAEYAVAPVSVTVNRPLEVSPVEGASLLVASVTALQALRVFGVNKFDGTGKTINVLITAASGGVGQYAVQLAKLANLHVTATCGARNIEFVKGLGADEVLDYKTPEGASLKSPSGRKYDAVIHCTTDIPWSTFDQNLSADATVVDLTPNIKTMVVSLLLKVTLRKKKLVPLILVAKEEDLKFVIELAKEGKLKTVIDSTYPLNKAEEAWAKSMSGHATGKIVVEMS